MQPAFTKSQIVINFRKQFLLIHKFTEAFTRLDQSFLTLSDHYKKIRYTDIIVDWIQQYIKALEQLHEEHLTALVNKFKASTKQLYLKSEILNQFNEIKEEVEDELVPVWESMMNHRMGPDGCKMSYTLIENYVEKIFQVKPLVSRTIDYETLEKEKVERLELGRIQQKVKRRLLRIRKVTEKEAMVLRPMKEMVGRLNCKLEKIRTSKISTKPIVISGLTESSFSFIRARSSQFYKQHYSGYNKDRVEEHRLPFKADRVIYIPLKGLWIGAISRTSNQTLDSLNTIFMFREGSTVDEFDNFYQLPEAGIDLLTGLPRDKEGSQGSQSKGSQEEIRENGQRKSKKRKKKKFECSRKSIKYNAKHDILSYYLAPDCIKLIESPKFGKLYNQSVIHVIEVAVKDCILGHQIMSRGRFIVLGRHGFIGIHDFDGALKEYRDIEFDEFCQNFLSATAFALSSNERYIAVALRGVDHETNTLEIYEIIEKEGIVFVDSWSFKSKSAVCSLDFSAQLGKKTILSAICQAEDDDRERKEGILKVQGGGVLVLLSLFGGELCLLKMYNHEVRRCNEHLVCQLSPGDATEGRTGGKVATVGGGAGSLSSASQILGGGLLGGYGFRVLIAGVGNFLAMATISLRPVELDSSQ